METLIIALEVASAITVAGLAVWLGRAVSRKY